MAVIGAIRKRSTLLLIVIGSALVLFVLSDFLSNKGGGKRQPIEPLAEVFEDEISFNEFDFEVQRQVGFQKDQNPEYSPGGMDMFQLRQQMFQQKVKNLIHLKYCKDLGLAMDHDYSSTPAISPTEFRDLLMGSDPHAEIRRIFTNPNTGEFDGARVREFLSNEDQMEAKQRLQWILFLDEIKRDRLAEKYKNLVTKAFYLPAPLAKMAFHEARDQATLRFVGKKYESIDDSLAIVTDEDYRKYYEEHKKEYDRDAQANMNYVIFQARPSQKDVAAIEANFIGLFTNFQTVEDPALFVNTNSHDRYDSTWFKKGELSPVLDTNLFSAEKGNIYGPYVEAGKYKAAKVIDTQDRADSLRASHILIAYQGAERAGENVTRTRSEAELLADSLLIEAKSNTALFDVLASTISDDASAKSKGGDLNWFNESQMAPEFSQACTNNNVGEIVLTQTIFGYHIIKVTGKKDFARQVRIAVLTHDIEPSKETIATEFSRASKFASAIKSFEAFEDALEKEGASGSEVILNKDMYSVGALQDAREIVRWAFKKETTPRETSHMFEFPENYQYVVCILKSRRDKGVWELDDELKANLEPLVKREKKFELIAKKMKKADTGDLYAMAEKMNLVVDTATISFNMSNLMNWGPEARVIGTAFSQPIGKITEPVKGLISAFTLVVDERVKADDPENLVDNRMNEERLFNQLIQQNFDRALEKAAKIKDNRILWF